MKVMIEILSIYQCPYRENEYGLCKYWNNDGNDCDNDIYDSSSFLDTCPLKQLAIQQTKDSIKINEG